ncbi:unnamed protein product, partial [Larinioides sclopetarius]
LTGISPVQSESSYSETIRSIFNSIIIEIETSHLKLNFYKRKRFAVFSIMLSAHQIYKENTDVTTTKNVKTNANAKPKGLGLKNATNICHNQKSNSGNLLDPKKNSNTLKKKVLKQELKSCTKGEMIMKIYCQNHRELQRLR